MLTPTLLVASQYDSNVEQISGDAESDFVTRIGVRLQLDSQGKSSSWSLGGSSSASLYAREPERNTIGHNATFSYKTATESRGPQLTFTDSLSVSPELNPDNDVEAGNDIGNGILIRRLDTVQNSARISATQPVSERLGMSLGYGHSMTVFTDDADVVLTDTMSHTGNIGASYALTRRDSFSAGYRYRRYRFSGGGSDATEDAEQHRDRAFGQAHSATLGWGRQLTRTAQGSLNLGESVVLQSGRGRRWAHLVSASLSLQHSDRFNTSLQAGNDLNTTSGLSSDVIQSRYLSGSARYAFTHRFGVGATVRVYYNRSLRGREEDDDVTVHVLTYGGGVAMRYVAATWCALSLSYGYSRQDVRVLSLPGLDQDAAEFERYQVSGTAVFSFK